MSIWLDRTRPNKTAKIPYAYKESEHDPLILVADEEKASLVEEALDYLDGGHSSRKTAEWLTDKTGDTITHQGLIHIWKTRRGKDSEKPSKRLKELAKENRKRKPKTVEEKKLASAKRKQTDAKRRLTLAKKKLEELQPSEELDTANLDFSVIESEKKKKEVVFAPNEGPQTEFLAAAETDVLYGGAAGGGKSYAMLVDPLRYCHRPAHRALILRRSMPELRELIDKSRELYPRAFPGCRFREVEKIWNFPSGAKLEFGFLERDADVYRYQGQAYSWIGFDEITHLNTEFSWNYLASRLRTTDPEITPYMRCTANPGGVGASWVKKRYVSPAEPSTSFTGDDGLTRRFIPARLEDNPYLAYDGRYEQMLNALPDVQRRQLLEGNWDITEGAAFTEFDLDMHVITPFEIPIGWERVKGIDYGYASESACIWGAVDSTDGTLIIYRELYRKGLTGVDLAQLITNMELEDPYSVQGVLDTAAWNRTGTTGPTVGETLQRAGHKLRRADKNRIQGKIQVHEYLRVQPSGRPKIQICNNCPNLIRELQSIPLDKSNPEDVDTHAPDHAYDALRYLIMSRPKVNDIFNQFKHLRMEQAYTPVDTEFGY